MASQGGKNENGEKGKNAMSSFHMEEDITKTNEIDMQDLDLNEYEDIEMKEMEKKISNIENKIEKMMGLLSSLIRGEGFKLKEISKNNIDEGREKTLEKGLNETIV